MSITQSLKLILLCASISPVVVLAQQKTIDDASKQIPTNKKGVEEAANQAAKRIELSKEKRAAMLKRAMLVQQQHAEYLAGIQSGKINPFQRFFDAYPKLSVKVTNIQQLHKHWLSEDNANAKQVLESQLLNDIQEVGTWLKIGDYVKGYDGVFTETELKEFERLERHPERHPAKLSESKLKLEYTSPTATWFTIQHLPVPVLCKAPAGAKVFLQATAGGQFENGLSIIEKVADDEGNVSTFWVSKGDTINRTQVKIVSPQCSNELYYNIRVLSPVIQFPAYLNAERMQQLDGQSAEYINKMLKKYTELEFSKLKKLSTPKASNLPSKP